jgi:phage gp29-like protein
MQANQDGYAIPKGVELRFTNEGIHSWPNFEALDANLQAKIRVAILGASDTQDAGDKGSFAAVKIRAQQVTPRQAQIANLISVVGSQIVRKASDFLYGSPRNYRLVPRFDDPIDPTAQRDGLRMAAELGIEVPTEHVYEVLNVPRPDTVKDKTMRLQLAPAAAPMPPAAMPRFAEDGLSPAERRAQVVEDEEAIRDRLLGKTESLTQAVAKELMADLSGKAARRVQAGVKKKAASVAEPTSPAAGS